MNEDLLTLEDALEDVEDRFLYNHLQSELEQPDRLFFQIEQAWWFYEDFMADRVSHLPHFKQLKSFAEKIFEHCPLLHNLHDKFEDLFTDFSNYKYSIPVYGIIMLNPEMTKLVLVCNWKGNSWSFPRGKQNEGEAPLLCAIREVYEETGFNATGHCKAENEITVWQDNKKCTLYIATDVSEQTAFEPQTRKEISDVAFFKIDSVPKNCWAVHPFIPKLKRWIKQTKQEKGHNKKGTRERRETKVEKQKGFDGRNDDTFAEYSQAGEKRWGVEAMFAANSKLTGQAYGYSGNPHDFGAAHPRYVDYNSTSSSSKPTKSNGDDDDEQLMMMMANASTIFRTKFPSLIRARNAEERKAKESLSSLYKNSNNSNITNSNITNSNITNSNNSVNSTGNMNKQTVERIFKKSPHWVGPRLPSPFVLNIEGIMAAIDEHII